LGLGRKFWPSFRDWRDALRIRGERIGGEEALAGASKEEGEEE